MEQAALRDATSCKAGYYSWLPALPEFRAQQQIGDDAFSRTESLPSAGLLLLVPSSRDLSAPCEVGTGFLTEAVTSNSLLLQRDER